MTQWVQRTDGVNIALIGDGPAALMTLSGLIDKAETSEEKPLRIKIIGQAPESNFGFGSIADTELDGVFANVLAKKMSISPHKGEEGLFVEHLKSLGLDKDTWEEVQASEYTNQKKLREAKLDTQQSWESAKNWITALNAEGAEIGDQYMPRILLQGMIRDFYADVKRKAGERIHIEYVQGSATDVTKDGNQAYVTIEGQPTISADVAAVTVGLPKHVLKPENEVSPALFCQDAHHPDEGNILYPDITGITNKEVIIIGSGLTAVDAIMALDKKGFFEGTGNRVKVVSPSGKFPYPHEELATNDRSFFLKKTGVPERLKKQATAKDLLDAIVLSALYAIGAEIDEETARFKAPKSASKTDKAVKRLVDEANNSIPDAEHNQLKRIFSQERKKYSWQSVMDHFRTKMEGRWEALSHTEQDAWLNHEPPYGKIWGDFRNRVPARIYERLCELEDEGKGGKIEMIEGKVSNIRQIGSRITVTTSHGEITGNTVINATGWGSPEIDSPLLDTMHQGERPVIQITHTDGVKNKSLKIIMIGQNDGNPKAISATGWTELRKRASDGAQAILDQLGREATFAHWRGGTPGGRGTPQGR